MLPVRSAGTDDRLNSLRYTNEHQPDPNNPGKYILTAGTLYSYSFDALRRPMGLTRRLYNNATGAEEIVDIVKDVVCGPAGGVAQIKYFIQDYWGPQYYTETRAYNSRLPLTQLAARASGSTGSPMNMQYIYFATQNNGQILQARDIVSASRCCGPTGLPSLTFPVEA